LFSADFCHPVIVTKDTTKVVWDQCLKSITSSTCSIAPGCNWSDGKELIPTEDFCAPMDLTTDVDLIKTCLTSETDATCVNGCQWRKGKDSTAVTPKPIGEQPLFTEEFCHPVVVSKDTLSTVWDICVMADTSATCSIAPGCNWSTGTELIPDHEFCAPMDLTKDVKLIQSCLSSDSATTCDEGCQWRKGTDSTDVTPNPTGP
jgi:hypothetical protein